MSNHRTSEAREGLLGSVAGKAKEVTGALLGKDDLVEEGQLQQAEARKRTAANADEAVAEAKREEAAQKLGEASSEAAEQKGDARARADREETMVEQQRQGELAAAARDAKVQEAVGREVAEEQADELAESRLRDAEAIAAEASATEQRAAAEKLRLEREAAAADQHAAQLRADTEN